MGDPGVEQAAGQRPRTRAGADRFAPAPGVDPPRARRPEAEHPDGLAADEDLGPGPAHRRVEGQAEIPGGSGLPHRRVCSLTGPSCRASSRRADGAARPPYDWPAAFAGCSLTGRSCRRRPGSTAPVMPLLSGPHSQAMSAAGSSGVSRRGRRCWAANSVGAGQAVDGGAGVEHGGGRRTGCHRVGRDAVRTELGGQAADEADDAVLGRAVGGQQVDAHRAAG